MKNTIIAIIIVAVAMFTVGLYVGDVYGSSSDISAKVSPQEKGDYKNTFDDGWRAAKERLEKSGFLVGLSMGEVKSLSGNVKSVNGNKIIINTSLLNPLNDESLKMRVINLVNDTEITLYKQKTEQEQEQARKDVDSKLSSFRSSRDDMEKRIATCRSIDPIMAGEETEDDNNCIEINDEYNQLNMEIMELEMGMMDSYRRIENAKLSDIKEGYSVVIISDDDVTNQKEITAKSLEVREISAPVENPAMMIPIEITETVEASAMAPVE